LPEFGFGQYLPFGEPASQQRRLVKRLRGEDEFEDDPDGAEAVPPMQSEHWPQYRRSYWQFFGDLQVCMKTSPICNLFLIEMASFFGLGPSTRMRDP